MIISAHSHSTFQARFVILLLLYLVRPEQPFILQQRFILKKQVATDPVKHRRGGSKKPCQHLRGHNKTRHVEQVYYNMSHDNDQFQESYLHMHRENSKQKEDRTVHNVNKDFWVTEAMRFYVFSSVSQTQIHTKHWVSQYVHI